MALNKTIDCFLWHETMEDTLKTIEHLQTQPDIRHIYLVGAPDAAGTALPASCSLLPTANPLSAATFVAIAGAAEAPYVLLSVKTTPLSVGPRALQRLRDVLDDGDSVWVYADHYSVEQGEVRQHPLIDYQEGALRNDFDFGSLLMLRTGVLKRYAQSNPPAWHYGGLYDLRLFCSREGRLFHLNEMLYTEEESDLRKSGERQFDYVNPAQRAVQVEMEQICTAHLKAIGGWLAPDELDDVDFSEGDFPVEASVIIPVRNRERTVADAIRSVLSQKAAFPFNVIVVDNHSTDGTTEQIRQFRDDRRVVHLIPERTDLGIGGCWDYAVCSPQCGRFAVQLDSDDLYSGPDTLQCIVDAFHRQRAAMVIGSYKLVDFQLNTLPPGIIDHREWTDDNGRNNALRINGLGAPRAFFTPLLRRLGFPNTSYGEDYALGLRISRQWRIGRIYDVLYLCRRWEGNSDAALSIEKQNKNNLYKDRLRTLELRARCQMVGRWNRKPDAAEVDRFFERQLAAWPEVRRRFEELTTAVETRTLACGDVSLEAQFNPARIRSTGAKVDKATISKRPCFLCEHNQPTEQIHLPLLGDFQLCVNPFPILPKHFTLPTRRHLPQQAAPQFRALCELAASLPDLVVFYNGAQCGASAPDHAHLQLGAKGQIPLQRDWKRYAAALEPVVVSSASEGIYVLHTFVYPLFVMKLKTGSPDESLFHRLTSALPVVEGEDEPRFNLIGWREGDHLVVTLIPRCKLRPQCYFEEGDAQMLISPGAVDMGGLLITPRREDFDRLTPQQATAILREVTLTEEEVKGCVDRI